MTRLILASASIARRALLTNAGIAHEAIASGMNETAIKNAARTAGHDARATAAMLARAKAETVARDHPDAIVIGADQILVCDGVWFDKPTDRVEARGHLRRLSGRAHALETATICLHPGVSAWTHHATPSLTMRALSDADIEHYLDRVGDAALGSVGAYQVEGPGIQLFTHIAGDWPTIQGLPLLPLLDYLRGVLP